MNVNAVKVVKLPELDGLEIKSATFLNKRFPTHFHMEWSLAFIQHGSENIQFGDFSFLLNKKAVILIPPYSLHANWGNSGSIWTYKAVYIHNEIIQHVARKLKIDFSQLASVPYFIHYLNTTPATTSQNILGVLELLFSSWMNETKEEKRVSPELSEIVSYLSSNYNSKITLEKLERGFKVNKYKLLRDFKKALGISPMAYQMAIRIEHSKKMFFDEVPLAHIALDAGFHDQSHFTHCFKKYVGVTPKVYQKHCNILQERNSFER